ncbi:MAG TPA: hypothetical protein VFO41_16620 [Alphaproteobacteria bacterium]|nr:hypothetical protein [Alphaproteobacteria bacterium]
MLLAAGTEDNGVPPAEEPGRPAAAAIYGRFGVLLDNADTTAALRIYDFTPLIADPAPLARLLERCGVGVKCFSYVSDPATGAEFRLPRLQADGYHKGTVWIYDPRVRDASFKDPDYTRIWRVTHELGHGVAERYVQERYGPSRRYGRLGLPMEGMRGVPPRQVSVPLPPLTLAEAQRAVEWEDVAFRTQRLLLAELGVTIGDDDFAREYNVNLADAVYRVVTGAFGDPGDFGFLPAAKPVPLHRVLAWLEAVESDRAARDRRQPTGGTALDRWRPVPDADLRAALRRAQSVGLKGVAIDPRTGRTPSPNR